MLTRRMTKLKQEEEEERNENESGEQQQQLSEEEQEEIRKENEAMKLVLQIPLVVEEMIGYLNNPDLMKCRPVCFMWRETATNIMLKKNDSQVNLIYDDKLCKFRKDVKAEKVQRADYLSELIKLFRKSLSKKTTVNKFPCSAFIIRHGPLGNPQIVNFFMVAGQQIKTLTLIHNDSTFDDLRNILEDHCPNLETLRIYRQNFQLEKNDVQITLLKLRVLSVGWYCPCGHCGTRGETGYEILKTIITPNLEILEDFDLGQDTNIIVEAGKVHTVKTLHFTNFDDNSRNYPELLQTLVNCGPQMESIKCTVYVDSPDDVNWEWINKMTDPLQQLLIASKDTLKAFQFRGLGFLFKNIQLPRFSKLTEIRFEELGYAPVRMFPIRINFAETFPNVTTIDLARTKLGVDENWDSYFPPPDAFRGQLTSVNTVKIPSDCSQNVKDKLRLICPNAEFK